MEQDLQHPWEYTNIVQVVTPKAEIDYSTKEGQKALANMAGRVFASLPRIIDKLPKGGWQVNSHNMMMVEGNMVVTILLQRPR